MKPCFHHHWEWNDSRLIFMAPGEASFETKVELGKKDKEAPSVPKLEFDPTLKTHQEHWGRIDERYGKSAYEEVITNYVDGLLPQSASDYRSAIVKNSSKRYLVFYDRIKGIFMKKAVDLKEKFDYSVDRIRDRAEDELGVLKSAVEGSRALSEFKDAMPAPKNNDAVEDHFEEYLDALNGRYFNADVNEGPKIPKSRIPILGPVIGSGIPILGPLNDPDAFKGAKYNSESKKFQGKMEDWVEAKLEWLLEKKGTTKQDLEAFRAQIEARYKLYSKIDGDSAIISGGDLAVLERASNPPLDAIGRILDEGDDQAIRRLEVMHLLNPDGWEDTIEAAGHVVRQTAINSGSEKEFTQAMKKYNKDIEDFDDAEDEFLDKLDELSKVGVRETIAFLSEFNTEVHSDVLRYEKQIEPAALTTQVHKQLDYLLGGVLVPHKDTDKMLVRFMTADLEERNEMLAHNATRSILFRAIRQATEQYPEIYDKQFGRIPDDPKKLRRSRRIEKPTFHDRAAQMQALIILGNQSKVIVSKINQAPEHRGKDYLGEIGEAKLPEETKVVKTGLRFKSLGKTARFRSALDRGGFNTRDLALKGAKVIGVLAVMSNVAQSFSETEGDFVDRIFETAERAATNQGVLAGAAVAVGAHMAERNPLFLKYPWLSQHERAGAMTAFKLDNLSARLSDKEVKRFTNNGAEWRALKHPAMDASQIKELLKEAGKRSKRGQKPVITLGDMRKVIPDETINSTLTQGGRSARMRYLFYSKFFASAVKPDVNHVKELCTGSSYISSEPVDIKKS